MTDDKNIEQAAPEPLKGPSVVLAEARVKLGLSQKDVADKLYLTMTFIKHIDAGEFDRIPKPAFIRGYLRSYARIVELSGDLIVELYEKELEAAEPTPEIKGVTDEKVGTAHITGPVLQTGLVGLVALLLVIALIWWLVSDGSDEKPAPRVTQSAVTGSDEVKEPEADAFNYVIEASVNGVGNTTGEVEENDSAAQMQFAEDEPEGLISSTDEIEPSSEQVDVAVSIPVEHVIEETESEDPIEIQRNFDGTRNFVSVDAGGFEQMDFTFREECWVEINDGQHGLIYNDLNKADDVLTIYGTLPFKVLLGKATGVEMIYNGRPFDLEPYVGQDETAKLTISE